MKSRDGLEHNLIYIYEDLYEFLGGLTRVSLSVTLPASQFICIYQSGNLGDTYLYLCERTHFTDSLKLNIKVVETLPTRHLPNLIESRRVALSRVER